MRTSSPASRPAWLDRMNRVFYFVPPLLLAGLEVIRQVFDLSLTNHRWWYLGLMAVALAGMLVFARVVSQTIERIQLQQTHQNQELLALHEASLAIVSDLQLTGALQRVVNEASQLIGAKYGAISYTRSFPRIDAFVTYGIPEEVRRVMGPPPTGHGVLGIPIASGETLRLADIGAHPASVGFPPHHPPMKRLLAVPISTAAGVVGNLYLADRVNGAPFTTSDEASLRRFSALAAIAIENAVLHDQVEVLAITAERERIAREMHDSLSQVLAYVNTKSQAALAYLARDDHGAARAQIEQLAATAREAYVDVREGIFALRSAGSRPSDTSIITSIRDYIEQWQEQHHIRVEFRADPPGTLGNIDPLAEIHLLRLIQEALSNVRKHAAATTVSVSIERAGVEWIITVRDNGSGFDPALLAPGTFPRFGLATMRERAEASGGTFGLVSAPEIGTTITVTLPVVQT